MAFDVTLEHRIRELCAQAVAAQESAELQPILAELRHALREHLEQLRIMVADYTFSCDLIDNRAVQGTQEEVGSE